MGKLSPARALALMVLKEVRQREAYASHLIDTIIDPSQLSLADKAFATRLVLGVISCLGTLDELINRSLNKPSDIKPKVRDALRISAYEMLYLGKEDHVAVNQGVELVRSVAAPAAGLANAVLHKMLKEAQDFPWGDSTCDPAALARKQAFPLWIVERLIAEKGWDWTQGYLELSNQDAPLFFAVNTLKATPEQVFQMLEEEGLAFNVAADDSCCLHILDKAQGVASDVLKHGYALVCDGAAQQTAALACPLKDEPYLEVGSGRGTKTILLQRNAVYADAVPSVHFALDNLAFKSQVLQQRLDAFGISKVSPVVGDATMIPELMAQGAFGDIATFGGAFLDVPCSGLGTLRRHPEIRWSISPEEVHELAQLGASILASVAPYVQLGGQIVYSTCTVFAEENQQVVEAFLRSAEGQNWRLMPYQDGEARCFYQGSPCQDSYDLHFAAVLERLR